MFPNDTRVLVVDDMNTMRTMVKNNLKTLGFTNIFEAENGAKAFQLLQTQHSKNEPIGLVLSDWNMPEMLGIDLLKRVRGAKEFKELPFLMITAEGEAGQVKEALMAGVSNYLMKPFSPASFSEKLTAVAKKLGK